MGKKKASGNNDMTAIINQLQKTYSVDNEDDIFESETAYEDTELSDLLAKILSDDNSCDDDGQGDEEELDLHENTSVGAKRKQKNSKRSGGADVSTDIQNIIMSEEYISVLRDCEADTEIADETSETSESQKEKNDSVEEVALLADIDESPEQENSEAVHLQSELISADTGHAEKSQLVSVRESDLNLAHEEADDGINGQNNVDEELTFGDLDDEESDVDEELTFGDLDDEESDVDEGLTFGDLDDEESDVDEGLTFGDLDDEESDVDESLTFGDLDDEQSDVDESLTFGDLDDEESDVDESLTFGDLDDEESDIDESLTFGDLDDEESDVDEGLTFGDLDDEESDVDESLTFGEFDDEERKTNEDVPLDDVNEDKKDVIATEDESPDEDGTFAVFDELDEVHSVDGYAVSQSPDYEDIADRDISQTETEKKFYYTVLEEMNLEDTPDISDTYTYVQKEMEEPVAENLIQVPEQPPKDIYIVLSKESYTDDPLQWRLDRVRAKLKDETEDDDTQETAKKSVEIEDDDISLLLQLGYKDELKSEVGQERTDSVVRSISNSYRPDKNKIPFGFCGKEFSDSSQIDKIKQRYDYDKRIVIIKLAFFACISLVLLLLGMLFKSYTTVNSVIMFSVMELLIASLGCVVMHKELVSGIKGVLKFSPTVFTMPLFSLLVLTAYDIFNIITCIAHPDKISANTTSLFGFTTSMFFIFALVVQLINCVREQKTFNLISASDELYTAETLVSQRGDNSDTNNLRSHEIRKQIKGNAVIVKKTKYISEYFKRCSESSYGIGGFVLILGVVPLAAIILACIIIATGRTAADVASTVVFAFYMCLSASFALIMPVTLFAASQSLAQKKCGIIGTGAVMEYADTNSVIFPDTSAFEIGNDIEVIPMGDVDMNSSMKTANRLFSALGGTLSDIVGENSFNKDLSVSEADINIASVDDNGIELYMDNETHILLGNEKYVYERRRQLSFEACDFIPSSASAGREVIYLAINGAVCLGYIISFGVKTEFTDKVKLLAQHSIKTYVSTYEPHIKAKRYNGCKIGVYRPYDHTSPSTPPSCYGGIVASGDAKNITYPLIMTSEILKSVKKSSKTSVWFVLGGIAVSFAITLVGYLVPGAFGLLRYRDVFTVISQLLSVIPLSVSAIKLWKKYK